MPNSVFTNGLERFLGAKGTQTKNLFFWAFCHQIQVLVAKWLPITQLTRHVVHDYIFCTHKLDFPTSSIVLGNKFLIVHTCSNGMLAFFAAGINFVQL